MVYTHEYLPEIGNRRFISKALKETVSLEITIVISWPLDYKEASNMLKIFCCSLAHQKMALSDRKLDLQLCLV